MIVFVVRLKSSSGSPLYQANFLWATEAEDAEAEGRRGILGGERCFIPCSRLVHWQCMQKHLLFTECRKPLTIQPRLSLFLSLALSLHLLHFCSPLFFSMLSLSFSVSMAETILYLREAELKLDFK